MIDEDAQRAGLRASHDVLDAVGKHCGLDARVGDDACKMALQIVALQTRGEVVHDSRAADVAGDGCRAGCDDRRRVGAIGRDHLGPAYVEDLTPGRRTCSLAESEVFAVPERRMLFHSHAGEFGERRRIASLTHAQVLVGRSGEVPDSQVAAVRDAPRWESLTAIMLGTRTRSYCERSPFGSTKSAVTPDRHSASCTRRSAGR